MTIIFKENSAVLHHGNEARSNFLFTENRIQLKDFSNITNKNRNRSKIVVILLISLIQLFYLKVIKISSLLLAFKCES